MMRKNPNDERRAGGGDRRRSGDRRAAPLRLAEEFERRLVEMEEIARANRRELGLQFTRIAQIQADLDALMKSGRSGSAQSVSVRDASDNLQSRTERLVDKRFTAMAPMSGDGDGRQRS
jgi:hypothetical protein